MLLKIESLEKEHEKLRKQLAEDKVEARAPRIDTLAEAIDRVGKGNVVGAVCMTYAKEIVVAWYRVCALDTILRETQTESYEDDAKKLIEDAAITQEPIAEI